MNNNPFLDRLMDDETGDIVHPSAYAKAQDGGTIGAASTESFTERQKINKNRSYIKKYDDSRVVTDASLVKRKELADRFGMPDGRPEKPPARRNPGISR